MIGAVTTRLRIVRHDNSATHDGYHTGKVLSADGKTIAEYSDCISIRFGNEMTLKLDFENNSVQIWLDDDSLFQVVSNRLSAEFDVLDSLD